MCWIVSSAGTSQISQESPVARCSQCALESEQDSYLLSQEHDHLNANLVG